MVSLTESPRTVGSAASTGRENSRRVSGPGLSAGLATPSGAASLLTERVDLGRQAEDPHQVP
jgi:hypothetical protein